MGFGGAAPDEMWGLLLAQVGPWQNIGFTLWLWPLWSVGCGLWSGVCGLWYVVWCWVVLDVADGGMCGVSMHALLHLFLVVHLHRRVWKLPCGFAKWQRTCLGVHHSVLHVCCGGGREIPFLKLRISQNKLEGSVAQPPTKIVAFVGTVGALANTSASPFG